jgi:pyrimidine deaminase RibD-like protein
MVAAVVVRDGSVISTAHRGEIAAGQHAEFLALDVKPDTDQIFAGATLYATLEPCTERGHTKDGQPKIPCAQRIIDRRIKRVVIGMLDPNPKIRGLGVIALRKAGIEVAFFDGSSCAQLEDLNREFVRHFTDRTKRSTATPATTNSPSPGPFILRASPRLAGFLSADQRRQSVVTMDVAPDTDLDGAFRLDIECGLQALRLRDESSKKVLYYAAMHGVAVDLQVQQGHVVSHSPSIPRGAALPGPEPRTQNATFTVEATPASADPPTYTIERGQQWTFETQVAGGTLALEVLGGRRQVRWDVALHGPGPGKTLVTAKVAASVRLLWAAGARRHGNIEVHPDEITFFDDQRRPLGWLRSLLMWRLLRKHREEARQHEGFSVDFEVADHG